MPNHHQKEALQDRLHQKTTEIDGRLDAFEKALQAAQSHATRLDAKQAKLQEATDRRFLSTQDHFAQMTLGVYETQADVAHVKNTVDQVQTRERDTTRLLQTLQSSHDQAIEWLQKLKHESAHVQTDVYTM